MKTTMCSDPGAVRPSNQDAVFFSEEPVGCLPNLFVVADGMGGHLAGDIASSETIRFIRDMIVETGIDSFPKQDDPEKEGVFIPKEQILPFFNRLVLAANDHLYALAERNSDCSGMGTTLVMVTILNHEIYAASVGDSRLYMQTKSYGLEQLTIDHNVPQKLVDEGLLSPEEVDTHPQRHVLTKVIGLPYPVEPDVFCLPITEKTRFLLCTDGLSSTLSDREIEEITGQPTELSQTAGLLLRKALQLQADDNVSMIMIEMEDEDIHAD